jgi:hypothetical protein
VDVFAVRRVPHPSPRPLPQLPCRSARLRAVGAAQGSPFVAVNNVFGEEYSSQPQINAALGRFFNPLPGVNYTAGLKLTS